MFIARAYTMMFLAAEERNKSFSMIKIFRSSGVSLVLAIEFYKHWVPLGPTKGFASNTHLRLRRGVNETDPVNVAPSRNAFQDITTRPGLLPARYRRTLP